MLLLVLVLIVLLLPGLRLGLGTGSVWAGPVMAGDVGRPDFYVDIFALVQDILAGVDGRGRTVSFFVFPVAGSHDVGGMHRHLVELQGDIFEFILLNKALGHYQFIIRPLNDSTSVMGCWRLTAQ